MTTRADDEKILHWLKLSDMGNSAPEIARRMGGNPHTISSRILAIRREMERDNA